MHNRARMTVASFLAKDVHLHWSEGERWFESQLADADLASNNGNWQWSAGIGADAAPSFRIFNPTLQARRFDAEGRYIRRYVPATRSWDTGLVATCRRLTSTRSKIRPSGRSTRREATAFCRFRPSFTVGGPTQSRPRCWPTHCA
jgi:deoxyribodipyrimidine photolyase